MLWTKPAGLVPGTVWRRFEGRRKPDGSTNRYHIRDVTPDDVETVIALMSSQFLEDEPVCHALETTSCPESVATIQQNWREYISQGVSLACFLLDDQDNERDLVAVNICLVRTKDDPKDDLDKVKGESWRKVLRTLVAAENTFDVFNAFNTDKYIAGSGMVVKLDHQGQNIGAELMKARETFGRALGLRVTATVMTAVTSQVLAAKCGWKVMGELPYSDMLDQGVDLNNCSTRSAKFMATTFD